ncbi:hypothetical protein [Flavobacterium sp. KJJ]|uniref:hypothetical protein n=1 Tax=Flavobacterium sp. KJJ TaxID=1270193 RepID=UPI000B2D892B|nr:hypothetical protein [Flavobacterium sp. KJJ]
MKNLRLLIMSFIVLTFLSCSEETMKQKDEISIAKNTGSTKKPAGEDCTTAVQMGPDDPLYNCYGLAFFLSEGLGKEKPTSFYPLYQQYFNDSIFVEDNSSTATKVLYWNNAADFQNKVISAVDHVAIITDSGNSVVYSKQGDGGLFKNCITFYYINPSLKQNYRTYGLNMALQTPSTAPKRGETFTVKLKHDARILEIPYTWEYDTDNLEFVSYTTDGVGLNLRVKDNAVLQSYSIKVSTTHQSGVLVDNRSFPKTLKNSYNFVLTSSTPIPPALTATFTGSNYVTKTSMGSWTATISGGTLPYQHFSWWIKRHEDPNSFYTQITTGNPIHLFTTTSSKPTYYDLYFRVVDANNQIFVTSPQLIQSTGPLEPIEP